MLMQHVYSGSINLRRQNKLRSLKGKKESFDVELILVFDDFERCSIPKDVLIGVLNEYLENRNIKTIIVADEDKIKDSRYKEYKEKLVSRTVKIDSDYDAIIESIVFNSNVARNSCNFLYLWNLLCLIFKFDLLIR